MGITDYDKYLKQNFNTKKVADGREISQIYYSKKYNCFRGSILGLNTTISIEWDLITGKSNLTSNSDLIKI